MIRSVFYCSDNGKKEEFVKKTDHEKDKASAVLAERKSTKDKIVEILETIENEEIERNGATLKEYLSYKFGRKDAISKAISKIEEEVK